MRKFLFRILRIVTALLFLVLLTVLVGFIYIKIDAHLVLKSSQKKSFGEVQIRQDGDKRYRDLNKNEQLDPYEDPDEKLDIRINDLINQMTIEEKAGLMFFGTLSINKDGTVSESPRIGSLPSFLNPGTTEKILSKNINHFYTIQVVGKRENALWHNRIQKLSEKTRLGIPITLATDPRNHFSGNPLASAFAGDLSLFPEPLGLGAIGDSLLVAQFADIARQEYLAMGYRVALHPQVDLATEPRWGRMNHTFGEDAHLTSKLAYPYIIGFQGDSIGPNSVACMTKHFSGGGPQKDGIDPHFRVQKGQAYPGNNFNYHLIPFEAAFRANTASIMPYYGVPTGQTSEEVAFAFNKDIITGLLREKYNYDGIICTDWGVLTDLKLFGMSILDARAWGMEEAKPIERLEKVIDAGCDQIGGELSPELLVSLVDAGKINENRVDQSVRRILRLKFKQGLFDNPFVDIEHAVNIVGNQAFRDFGELAQKRSVVMLKNDTIDNTPILPLKEGIKIYVQNMNAEVVSNYGVVVSKPDEADVAIIRLHSPKQKLKGAGPLGSIFGSGDLDYKEDEKTDILNLIEQLPTIVDIYFERPPVIPEISALSSGLFVNFGATDKVMCELIFGRFNPQGKLPVEIPASMSAVKQQKEDVPYDSDGPLYEFGFGLTY